MGRGEPLPPCTPSMGWPTRTGNLGLWGQPLRQESCLCSSQVWSRAWGSLHRAWEGASRGRGQLQAGPGVGGAARAHASSLPVNAHSREGNFLFLLCLPTIHCFRGSREGLAIFICPFVLTLLTLLNSQGHTILGESSAS